MPLSQLEDLSIYKQNTRLDDSLVVECEHENILVYGRYNKYSREMSQTPWAVDGQTTKAGSVQCCITGPLKEIFGCQEALLHGSGREDIDVRMLGQGRPFIAEFINPKKAVSCHQRTSEFESLVQSDLVKCNQMKIANKEIFD